MYSTHFLSQLQVPSCVTEAIQELKNEGKRLTIAAICEKCPGILRTEAKAYIAKHKAENKGWTPEQVNQARNAVERANHALAVATKETWRDCVHAALDELAAVECINA